MDATTTSERRAASQTPRSSDPRFEALDLSAEALRGVQEAARSLSRSLGEADVAAELGRQAARLAGPDVVAVVRLSLEDAAAEVVWRSLRGQELPQRRVHVPPGLLVEAARSGRRMATRGTLDAAALALDDLDLEGLALASAVAVPMVTSLRLEGVLLAAWRGDAPPAAEDTLEALAAHGSLALRNARLYAESERERRQSDALAAAAAAIGASLRVGEVHRLVLQHAQALLGADGAAIALVEDRYASIAAAAGSAAVLAGRLLPLDASLAGEVIRTRSPRIVNDIAGEGGVHRPSVRAADLHRVLGVPLLTAHGVIGVLAVTERAAPFTEEDARCLQRLADTSALAIQHARQFAQAEADARQWEELLDAVPLAVVLVDDQGMPMRGNARARAIRGLLPATPGAEPPAAVAEALATGAEARGRATAGGVAYDLRAWPCPGGGVVLAIEPVPAPSSHAAAAWPRS